jgi:hypothetical protein
LWLDLWDNETRFVGRRLDVFPVVSERGEQVRDVVVMKAVVGVSSVPLDVNESGLPEKSKLMRRCALCQARNFSQFIDGPLVIKHRPEQLEAAAGSEKSYRLGQFLGLFLAERSHSGIVFGRMRQGTNRTTCTTGGGPDA